MLSADFITNRDQMCVYAIESVGWILIIAIWVDLFTPLAGARDSQYCRLAVLGSGRARARWWMGWDDPFLSFSSLSPILVEAHQSVTDYPCSTSAVFIPIPPPKQGKTLVNVGLLWDSTAIMKPLVLPGAFVPHRRLGSSPAICWG